MKKFIITLFDVFIRVCISIVGILMVIKYDDFRQIIGIIIIILNLITMRIDPYYKKNKSWSKEAKMDLTQLEVSILASFALIY